MERKLLPITGYKVILGLNYSRAVSDYR